MRGEGLIMKAMGADYDLVYVASPSSLNQSFKPDHIRAFINSKYLTHTRYYGYLRDIILFTNLFHIISARNAR